MLIKKTLPTHTVRSTYYLPIIQSYYPYRYSCLRRHEGSDPRRRLVAEGSRRVLPFLESHFLCLGALQPRILPRLRLRRPIVHQLRGRRGRGERRQERDGHVPIRDGCADLQRRGPPLQPAGLAPVPAAGLTPLCIGHG